MKYYIATSLDLSRVMSATIIDFRKQARMFGGRTFYQFLQLGLGTLLCNIMRVCVGLVTLVRSSDRSRIPKQLIILGSGGIGNHLMLVPMVRSLKESYPDMNINVVASSRVCAELLEADQDIASLSVMDIAEMNRFSQYWRAGKALKALNPDAVIAAVGTEPVAGSVISFLSGAGFRAGEDWKGRGFFYNYKIKANQRISELDQNMSLAKFFGIKVNSPSPSVCLRAREIEEGRRWISHQKIPQEAKILGIHPGCGSEQKWKRWEIERYIRVSKEITEKGNVWSIFFIGPDEHDLVSCMEGADLGNAVIYHGASSIRNTAAIMGCCDFFLSNDSGLRHVAAALGVRTVGIFGPTSVEKNFYGGDRHRAVFLENFVCRPCHYTRWWLACGDERPCLKSISTKALVNVLSEMIG